VKTVSGACGAGNRTTTGIGVPSGSVTALGGAELPVRRDGLELPPRTTTERTTRTETDMSAEAAPAGAGTVASITASAAVRARTMGRLDAHAIHEDPM
jgi:hypothetical protein